MIPTSDRFSGTFHCTGVDIGAESPVPVVGFPRRAEENRVHIWSARYAGLAGHLRAFSVVISQKEQDTASTFRSPADAEKYVIRQGVLRTILGNYTGLSPETLSLTKGTNGKPELDDPAAHGYLTFNLSHSEEMVLIGITRKRRIGVDIVSVGPSFRYHETAEYILTPAERAVFHRIDPALRHQVFFRIWAVKEALLKATGSTLAMMATIDLSGMMHDAVSPLEYSMSCLDSCPPFYIWQFSCGTGHFGAIAVEATRS